MILVLAGTADAREVISRLKGENYPVAASAVSPYGARLAAEAGADPVLQGALAGEQLSEALRNRGIRAVVDATHPFAGVITRQARDCCREMGLPYYRYRRPPVEMPQYPGLMTAVDWQQAVEQASRARIIFLAIGTRNLQVFKESNLLAGRRIIVRVLPDVDSINECRRLGIWPEDIVAMQGPFGYELNAALFRHFGVDLLVTKDSGRTGGVDSKVQAAMDLGIKVVVVQRPPEPDAMPMEAILKSLGRDLRLNFGRVKG